MGSFDKRYVEVLASVVEAGRTALRLLEDDQVPAKLMRVARSTGRGLPAPLAVSLLSEIDTSDWLRAEVLEAYEAAGRGDDVAEAFLRRGDGWWLTVATALADAEGRRLGDEVAEARSQSESARSRLDAARSRERRLQQRIAQLEAAGDAGSVQRTSQLRSALDRERRRADEAEAAVRSLEGSLAARVEEVADMEERQRQLYERLQRMRAERAELERRLAGGSRGAIPADPVGIARWLDDAGRVMAPYRPAVSDPAEAAPPAGLGELRLPPGVRPDSPEAIEAIRGLSPRWVLVDGHNVIGAIDRRTIGDASARRSLVTDLGLLARALTPAAIVVVFDSALGGARESVEVASGVTVRFSPPAAAADDVIVEEARELGAGSVVVSNDREVRERSAAAGALPLWSDALVAWLAEAKRAGIGT